MIFFYILPLVPILIGGLLWMFTSKVNWIEWLVGSLAAFAVSGIMHFAAYSGQTDDIQMLSGQVTSLKLIPEWRERYSEAVYRTETYTTGSGKNRQTHMRRVFSHYATRYETHPEQRIATTNIENHSISLTRSKYDELRNKLGTTTSRPGSRSTSKRSSTMVSGDPYDYITDNSYKFIEPVNTIRHWTNKVKGSSPSVFSFKTVPENAPVYEWPESFDDFSTRRVIGASVSNRKWDEMNARLGPRKRVNVILINFVGKSADIAEVQRAKWIGGKKNDLVLCYSEKNGKTLWANVFSWSNSELAKSNLSTILLENPVNDSIIPLIEEEILKNYKVRDFEKDFDYLDIQPRPIHYLIAVLVMALTQGAFWIYAYRNEHSK